MNHENIFPSIAFDRLLEPPTVAGSKLSISVNRVEIGNSTGSAASAGWGIIHTDAMWQAGQWDNSSVGSEATDDTTDAQDSGTNDFALTTTTDDDGFYIESDYFFGLVEINVGVAAAGGSPVYEYSYYNGSSWTTFTPKVAPDFSGTGKKYLLFNIDPSLWSRGGVTAGKLAIRCRATTAPSSTAALASTIKIATLEHYLEKVADGDAAKDQYLKPYKLPFRGALTAYCSAANANNWMKIEYSLGG